MVTDLSDLFATVDQLPTGPAADADLAELVHQWDLLETVAGMLSARVKAWAVELGDRLTDIDGTEYETDGVVVHRYTPRTYRFKGREILETLSHPVVDLNSGDKFPAVATEVLYDIVPAVRGVSSRWNVTGLERWGVPVGKVRTVEYGDPIAKRGPKP